MSEFSAPPMPVDVAAAFAAFPVEIGARLTEVRNLIFATAAEIEGVGRLTETLKWGEPAYLTEATGSGVTIRLGLAGVSRSQCAMFFNCRTTLVETFRERFPEVFDFQKSRAILFSSSGLLPEVELSVCIRMALTYHRRLRAFA